GHDSGVRTWPAGTVVDGATLAFRRFVFDPGAAACPKRTCQHSGVLTWPKGPCCGPRRLGAEDGAARAGEEARFEEERHDVRLAYRLTVEALDRQAAAAAGADVRDEGRERRAQPCLVGVAE